ncbi:TraM recognition domain-containing protein [Gordonia sp. SID5947]|uniref:type IV secretory system conjugative DNA transfer family protein n=1 Tax=Gordonia sp. SID5947 TaxID=2690315 RepID=UPI00136DB11D|nr:TraM recognition domain-containing protein [Gordonia sp. SID5947]MYR08984.1 TraM recognition domain-containing protein [Gordonia sp. SID5947]
MATSGYRGTRSATQDGTDSTAATLIIGGVVAIATLGCVVSVAGALSGLLAGHGWAWPSGDDPALFAGLKATITSPSNPAAAWPGDTAAGSGWLFWVCFAVLVAAVGVLAWKVWAFIDTRRARAEAKERGLATATDLAAANLTEAAAVMRARRGNVTYDGVKTRDIDPAEAAIYVGELRGRREPVYVQHRDCTICEGPTGAGKTWRIAVQRCWDAPGFLAATTTKVDMIAATIGERKEVGDVEVFDPTGLTGWPKPLRWAMLAGCEEPETAIERAAALVQASPMEGVRNSSFWEVRAATVIRCFMMAAALDNQGLMTVRSWVNLKQWKPAYEILHGVYADWANDLKSVANNQSESTDDVFGTASMLLDPLADPSIARMVDVPRHESIDLESFVLGGANTLYLACKSEQKKVAPIVSALTAEVYRILDRQSQREPNNRLAVPARLVLDEVNNIAPIPHLPDKMTDSGGRGISIWAFAHNRLQNIKRWGQTAGQEFTINAPNRIILPGLGDQQELDSLSRLFGTRYERMSPDPHDIREKAVLSVDEIREMEEDQALMIYRGTKPIMLTLPQVWDRPDLAHAAEASADLFNRIRATGDVTTRLADMPTKAGQ